MFQHSGINVSKESHKIPVTENYKRTKNTSIEKNTFVYKTKIFDHKFGTQMFTHCRRCCRVASNMHTVCIGIEAYQNTMFIVYFNRHMICVHTF